MYLRYIISYKTTDRPGNLLSCHHCGTFCWNTRWNPDLGTQHGKISLTHKGTGSLLVKAPYQNTGGPGFNSQPVHLFPYHSRSIMENNFIYSDTFRAWYLRGRCCQIPFPCAGGRGISPLPSTHIAIWANMSSIFITLCSQHEETLSRLTIPNRIVGITA